MLEFLEAAATGKNRRDPAPVLLLLHAFPLSAMMWEPQMSLSESGWRIIAPHFRGFSGTPFDPLATSMDEFAEDVIQVLNRLQVESAVVAGLSMGGYASFALMRRAPERIRGLVLADTRAQADTPEGVAARNRMIGIANDQGANAVADEMLPKLIAPQSIQRDPALPARIRGIVRSNARAVIAAAVEAMKTRPDSVALLDTIHVPTLVVTGADDALIPPSVAEDMAARIPGSTLAVIPDAGHLPNLEQPALFNAAVAGFLASSFS